MKKILIIFFIIAGIAIIFNTARNIPWLPFGSNNKEIKLTNKIEEIELNLSSAKVNLITEQRDTVKAEVDGRGKISLKQKGDKITVNYTPPKFRMFSFLNPNEVNIYLPNDYDEDIFVDLSSGTLNFSADSNTPPNLHVLDIKLGSGAVRLENLATDSLNLNVSSGNLTATKIDTDKGTVKVSSGRTVLKEFTGELEVNVLSGLFSTDFSELTGSIDATVKSGSMTLTLPKDSDFTLETNVKSGHFSNEFSMKTEKEDEDNYKGTYGKGTHDIDIQISSGQAKIKSKKFF